MISRTCLVLFFCALPLIHSTGIATARTIELPLHKSSKISFQCTMRSDAAQPSVPFELTRLTINFETDEFHYFKDGIEAQGNLLMDRHEIEANIIDVRGNIRNEWRGTWFRRRVSSNGVRDDYTTGNITTKMWEFRNFLNEVGVLEYVGKIDEKIGPSGTIEITDVRVILPFDGIGYFYRCDGRGNSGFRKSVVVPAR